MTYLIIGAALLVVLFVAIETRLRATRARASRQRARRPQRSDPQRLRRGRAELRLVTSTAGERARHAHG